MGRHFCSSKRRWWSIPQCLGACTGCKLAGSSVRPDAALQRSSRTLLICCFGANLMWQNYYAIHMWPVNMAASKKQSLHARSALPITQSLRDTDAVFIEAGIDPDLLPKASVKRKDLGALTPQWNPTRDLQPVRQASNELTEHCKATNVCYYDRCHQRKILNWPARRAGCKHWSALQCHSKRAVWSTEM